MVTVGGIVFEKFILEEMEPQDYLLAIESTLPRDRFVDARENRMHFMRVMEASPAVRAPSFAARLIAALFRR